MAETPPPTAPLHRTPLHQAHIAAGARMTPFGGWDMPLSYEGQLAEHKAVRTGAGIFDVSHMGQVRIGGPEANEFLQWLVPADVTGLRDHQSRYTQLVNEFGGVEDDLIISRLGTHEFFAVVNASTREADVEWMKVKALQGAFDVRITDESVFWGMIALQGPDALYMLESLIPPIIWSDTPAFTLHQFNWKGVPHLLSRTGYTGEKGAEILCPAELTTEWWEHFLRGGAKPCGLAARDTLRLEAGYCLYGQDLNPQTSPVEANLGWSVGWKKPEEFIGRAILEKQKAIGPARKLVGLRSDSRRPLRHGDQVVAGDQVIGEVTSGGFSPMLEVGIALAYVATEHTASGTTLAVRSRGADIPVRVAKPPFVQTSLTKKKK